MQYFLIIWMLLTNKYNFYKLPYLLEFGSFFTLSMEVRTQEYYNTFKEIGPNSICINYNYIFILTFIN